MLKELCLLGLIALGSLGCKSVAEEALGATGLGPETIVREQKTLKDGERALFLVRAGIYRVDVTAVPAPVSITWVGASCNDVKKTKEYSERCYVETSAQLLVENPAALGFIGSGTTSITYTLTRLPD